MAIKGLLSRLTGLPRRTKQLVLVAADFLAIPFLFWAALALRYDTVYPPVLPGIPFGPFLVGAAGFSASLLAAGVLTLRTGALSRWTGYVALLGAGCFAITLLTILNNVGDGSAFGYAFFPAMLSFVVWTVATSLARYRALAS